MKEELMNADLRTRIETELQNKDILKKIKTVARNLGKENKDNEQTIHIFQEGDISINYCFWWRGPYVRINGGTVFEDHACLTYHGIPVYQFDENLRTPNISRFSPGEWEKELQTLYERGLQVENSRNN
ncbi:MAG: hypothetical protein U9R08_02355 [Nanoarchaeota archaeon]|nr:hypothetical protein [Nanoarchaeota archaeon]